MDFLLFSLGFTLIHIGAYYVAGMVNYSFTKDLYGGENGLLTSFLRDMSDPDQSRRVNRMLLPAQLARGLLMSVVLYPVLDHLGDISFGLRFLFLGGLMFIYADLASAAPFSNNIEGLVYMKRRFVEKSVFWKIQSEALVYSAVFGGAAAWFLF